MNNFIDYRIGIQNKVSTNNKYINDKNDIEQKKGTSFSDILNQQISSDSIKFSKHAEARMNMRNIKLDSTDIDKVSSAIDAAQKKGIKDSLIVMNNVSFIVNIPSKTVITAVDNKNSNDNIFTNIDGAVFI